LHIDQIEKNFLRANLTREFSDSLHPLRTLDGTRLPLNYRGTILWHAAGFGYSRDIGFLFQLIGQYQQVPVNQSIAVGWNARHSPQEFCLLAKLLNTDHVLNVSSVSAPALDGRLVGPKDRPLSGRSTPLVAVAHHQSQPQGSRWVLLKGSHKAGPFGVRVNICPCFSTGEV